jgi:hypothetical protein
MSYDEEMWLTRKGKIALMRLAEALRMGKRSIESVENHERILLVFMAEACKDAGLEVGLLRNDKEVYDFIHGPYTQFLDLLDEQGNIRTTLM